MIKFKSIRWKNLLSTGNEFTEIQLDKAQTTLIVGENGAGKSTFLEALTYSLFGKPFRKINKPQLVNSMTRKNMVVEVEFSVGSNSYKIVRGIRPNVFEIYMNGAMMDQSSDNKDYQEILEKQILKVNYKSFCQVVVLGSASYVPFMQLPTGQRREIIEDLLDLQVFTVMNNLLKDRLYFNAEDVRSADSEKKLLIEKIKLVKKHSAEREEDDRRVIEDREQAIASTNTQIDQAKIKRAELVSKAESLMLSIGDEKTAIDSVKKINRLKNELDIRVENISQELKFFHDNTTCPTCAQEIDPEFRETHVHSKTEKVEKIRQSMPDLLKKLGEAQAAVDGISSTRSMISEIRVKISTIDSQISTYEDYIKRTQREIDDIRGRTRAPREDDIDSLEEQLRLQEKKMTELTEQGEVLNLTGMMLKDGGIKSKIVKQYIPVMNKFINKYLSALDFFVQFELDENFQETIRSRFRDEFSYESFSEGEKMRLNLAILFAWRAIAKLRNSINTNILVLDEVFDSSLDVNGTDEFMKMLNGLTSDTNTFIISHKTDSMVDKFENVLKFTKIKSFSKLVA
jgi:DNA repair exonuclease SbcCD ATPase subunit